ncbi:MAG: glycosyltransferase family 4 protein [Gemmatimonadales bacterium]
MRHVLVAREFPPAPGGGIGTYSGHIARALVDAGETVHVIGVRWPGAEQAREESHDGRLVVHRLPVDAPGRFFGTVLHPAMPDHHRETFRLGGAAAAFADQVAELLEHLVLSEAIDVVEAPEYEAPLAPFQARRALGLGPHRTPPCVIHLHSPSELIATANGATALAASAAPIALLERYTIANADRLCCPSLYLAQQAERHFGLAPGIVEVIPCPFTAPTPLRRPESVWRDGTILFMGRLELRKGILEWVDAAVLLAAEHPSLRFEFAGSDHVDAQLGGTRNITRRIPTAMRSRFRFHDHQDAAGLAELLACARLVVVPSRWENFPYTCVEAMASGVPVIASPNGGMREMITHGVDGWIARTGAPHDMANAVREALAVGPDGLAEAGRRAGESITQTCQPGSVVARHLRLAANRSSQRSGTSSRAIDAETVLAMSWLPAPASGLSRWIDLARMVRRAASRPAVTMGRIARHIGMRHQGVVA